MKKPALVALGTALLCLSGCGDTSSSAEVEQEHVPMTEDEKRLAKNQCEIQAILQGGSNEQATALCDCTIEALAVGRSGEELEVLDAETANEALNICAADLGIG